MSYFVRADNKKVNSSLNRFDARFFTLDFRTGSVATVIANDAYNLTVNCQFRSNIDLVGLFWNSSDNYGHPLLKYVTDKNYTGTIKAFIANPLDPYSFSATIKSGAKSYIYRLFPYKISGSNLVCDVTNALIQGTGTGRTYSISSLFPSGLTIPTGYQVYIVDFDNLFQGYNFDLDPIPADSIDSLFYSIISSGYGIGTSATLDNASNVNLTTWNISNVPAGFRCQAGDVIIVTYTQGSQYFSKEVTVTSFTRPTSTTLRLTMANPINNATWIGGKVSTKVLSLDSAIGDVALQFKMLNISVTGSRTTIGRYYYPQPANGLQIATGYDDSYNITPWRQAHQIYDLGYRSDVVCYMGASHYYQSYSSLIDGVYYNQLNKTASTPLNTPTVAWCQSLFAELYSLGLGFIWSTSLEILLSAMPDDWAQKDYLGDLAASGYTPPTSFLSIGNTQTSDYIISVISQGLSLMQSAGLALKFQLGEFWSWDGSYSNGRPCIYDYQLKLAYFNETGNYAPQDPISPAINTSAIYNIYQTLTPAQTAYATWVGDKLGRYTKHISDTIKSTYTSAQSCLLFFSPQIFATNSVLLPLLNFPSSYWKYSSGTYDFMQIEDYDWIIAGQIARLQLTLQAATGTGTLPNGRDELGYPSNLVHYFVGFVFGNNENPPLGSPAGTVAALSVWDYCSIALQLAQTAGLTHLYIWAYPQVIRDGIVISNSVYTEPTFPLGQSWFALVAPQFNTIVETSEADYETRVNSWGGLVKYNFILQSRDILPNGEVDRFQEFQNLNNFVLAVNQGQNQLFRTKKGVFRLNCQSDNYVNNQQIGVGNGTQLTYQLIKTYTYDNYTYTRNINKPNAQPVIYFNGVVESTGWYCDLFSGVISFAIPPASGVIITADITYDFSVRFNNDPFPFTIAMDYGNTGLNEISFTEDIDSYNSFQTQYGSHIESKMPSEQSYFLIANPKSKSSFVNTESMKHARFSSYGKNLLLEFDMQARDILYGDSSESAFNNFIKFYLCVAQGSLNSFRLKYDLDYQITNQQIGIGDGVKTQFQVYKEYISGSLTYKKTIKKLVLGTVSITQSTGSILYTVDYNTGMITFNSAPANGVIIRCTCEFDYMVRFESSKLETSLDVNYGTYGLSDIKLIEVRE